MSGPPRVRSMNIAAEPEPRSILGPTENKEPQKLATKALKKHEKPQQQPAEAKDKRVKALQVTVSNAVKCSIKLASIVKQQEAAVTGRNLSMNRSWSSDASSSDSSQSRPSSSGRRPRPRKQCAVKVEKVESGGCLEAKKRCAWVTPNTDSSYAAFHDEEWGIPVHDDMKLFELLSLSGALAELTWPVILHKRCIFREVFSDFDPIAVSKLNEKKIASSGSPASFLLSELKLRGIIENARQVCKVIDEFGSFQKYIWSFVNHKPIVSQFRYPRQVPVKTPKAEFISKDLVRRGFRSVGPTVIYSFMQVAGLTNDHLTTCFRFQDCISGCRGEGKVEKTKLEDVIDLGLARAIND
ncbi:Adenine_glyco domain-containing protein [Cephalotus follicularis]|uniref:Adenine_glyco domain-containing protein n=1 Tax=Cephalotus follicularis TaxID=3775 RepID=A0A1Q3BTY1_CEPFO|nr:Adenine_glyco domain-containing protein [Cephalotus follicularis]